MADGKEFSGVDDVFASIRSDEQSEADVLKPTDPEVGGRVAVVGFLRGSMRPAAVLRIDWSGAFPTI